MHGRRPRAALLAALAAVLAGVLWSGAPLAAGNKGPRVTPGDRAATRTYLDARLAFLRAQIATAPASGAAVKALEASLERECPGVMTGAPHETLLSVLKEGGHKTPREEGEDNRHGRQFEALQSEVLRAIETTDLAPARAAALAYINMVRPLRWSEPGFTSLTQLSVATLEFEVASPVPGVCSDMRAWVSSGYRTLSESSKSIERVRAEEDARVRAVLLALAERYPSSVPSLERLAGPRERRLARTVDALEASKLKADLASDRNLDQLEVSLGLESQAEREESEHPHKGSVEIGHGRTLADTRFKVYVEPPRTEPGPLGETVCKHPITVDEEPVGNTSVETLVISSGGSPGQGCLSPSHPVTECEAGALTIELRTVAAARRVRLTLGNGRRVSSHVAPIPRRLGGPGGVYYQAVKGPPPGPVSLEELGARGRVLRTITLAHPPKCRAQELERPARHTRSLVAGALPGGGTFTINGTLTTYEKQKSFNLEAEASTEGLGSNSAVEAIGERGPRGASAFTPKLKTGCEPGEFAIVYGVLHAPRDVVLVRTASGLVPLRHVSIPKALHAGGVLAYVALTGVPEQLLVRNPRGKTVFSENLTTTARDSREVCEGEAEG